MAVSSWIFLIAMMVSGTIMARLIFRRVAMGPLEITGPARLALGLVTGILFGFILQKAQVTKYQKIVSFFRWSDLTVQKVMFAAPARLRLVRLTFGKPVDRTRRPILKYAEQLDFW
jgi:hypothetical protein